MSAENPAHVELGEENPDLELGVETTHAEMQRSR